MTVSPRIEELSGDWDFTYSSDVNNTENPQLPPEEAFSARMPVPGYWDDFSGNLQGQPWMQFAKYNEDYQLPTFDGYLGMDAETGAGTLPDSSLPFLSGVGWYRKYLDCPGMPAGGKITLEVGQVAHEAWVWLNKKLLCYHFGHSSPFEASLEKDFLPGMPNELVIAVRNTRRDRFGCNLRGFKGYSGGISRHIKLKFAGSCRLDGLYVRTENSNRKLIWNAGIDGSPSPGIKEYVINWLVRDPANSKVLEQGTVPAKDGSNEWETAGCGMSEWSDTSPTLYRLELELVSNGKVQDRMSQSFGLRSVRAENCNLYLNDNPLFLRGITEHCYFPLSCNPPFDVKSYREMLLKLQKLGFNWVRCHTWTPSDEYLDAADELGMLVQVAPPVGFEEQEWLDIIRKCRRHPSVVIYCCGNEELLDEKKIKQLSKMAKILRCEAPDALFNPQEALRGIEYSWNDHDFGREIVDTPFRHNSGRLRKIKKFSDVFGQYAWAHLSYDSASGNWREIQKNMHVYERPCLSHEIGIHGYYTDLRLEKRYKNTRIGHGIYTLARKTLEKAGMLDRARLYYENSCKWAGILRKQAIENTRKCSYAGYDFLGGTDHHYHQCGYHTGIMNEFYELKPGETAEEIRNYNGESVLLLDCTVHRNLYYNDKFNFELFASLFGKISLKNGKVQWSLNNSTQQALLAGESAVTDIKNGAVSSLGHIVFEVPELAVPDKLTLSVKLIGEGYSLKNKWEFWAFPKTRMDCPQNVKCVESLDADSLEHLRQGSRVALFGDSPFKSLELKFQIAVAGRVHGNLSTIIYNHPLTNKFPHDGFCSWQFFSMFENTSAILFNDGKIPFDPIIEVGSTYKDVKKQACMFELAVGDGKLFVCSLNLAADDPGATFLKSLICEYTGGSEFNPVSRLEFLQLEKLLGEWSPEFRKQAARTVQAFDPNAQRGKKS